MALFAQYKTGLNFVQLIQAWGFQCTDSRRVYLKLDLPRTSWTADFFKLWANPGLFLVYFRPFFIQQLQFQFQFEKSIDGVLGIRPRGHRIIGADETTELWRLPLDNRF